MRRRSEREEDNKAMARGRPRSNEETAAEGKLHDGQTLADTADRCNNAAGDWRGAEAGGAGPKPCYCHITILLWREG